MNIIDDVYLIDRIDCDACYIGQVSKYLKSRLLQHGYKDHNFKQTKTELSSRAVKTRIFAASGTFSFFNPGLKKPGFPEC